MRSLRHWFRAGTSKEEALSAIADKQDYLNKLIEKRSAQALLAKAELGKRAKCIDDLPLAFAAAQTSLDDGMTVGIESGLTERTRRTVSQDFNLKNISNCVDREAQLVRIEKAQDEPGAFLEQVSSGAQRIKQGANPVTVAVDVLTTTPEIRFFATIDGDRIGGFERSSMTPGKQALFALTLILNESTEAWPLLIDQPEDDLDSRSIYDHIVPYLVKRKSERQILMVSHNANLVVGADSEQIIVANRHGDDRRNRADQTFSYRSGSLEHSSPKNTSAPYVRTGVVRHTRTRLEDTRWW